MPLQHVSRIGVPLAHVETPADADRVVRRDVVNASRLLDLDGESELSKRSGDRFSDLTRRAVFACVGDQDLGCHHVLLPFSQCNCLASRRASARALIPDAYLGVLAPITRVLSLLPSALPSNTEQRGDRY